MEEAFRKNIVDYAYIYLGKPYVWGAKGPDSFDCSGFTYYIFYNLFNIDINKNGYGEGDTTKQMTNDIGVLRLYDEGDNNKFDLLNDIRIGDLVFFHRQSLEDNKPSINNRYPGHVGIYIGNNKFIHASFDDRKVVISDFDDYWTKILVASRDIVSEIIKSTI